MRRGRKTDAPPKSLTQLFTDNHITTELTTAWRGLAQSKAALRHIENHIEATSGSGVLLDSIAVSPKRKSPRKVNSDADQIAYPGGSSKPRARSQQSPAKSSSRSPLRNATQDSNVRKTSSVDFKEPLVAYREATPPPHTISQLETGSPPSVPGSLQPSSLPHSDCVPSQQTNTEAVKDMDGTRSSAPESAEVRYLNDQPALDVLKNQEGTFRAEFRNSKESSPLASNPGSSRQGESTPSSSPGSASQRLENLRRHQPDDKLEKLKERIRRQRQHLEEAAEREKLQGRLEQPIVTSVGNDMPTAKVRKVAVAPPAPIYKGFNNVETKIQTPDGNVWKEEEFHSLSREICRDLSRQFAETTRQRQREQKGEKSRKSPKPVRKVHRLSSVSKAVISPASWREGQKLVKMVLGPVPKSPREEAPSSSGDRRSGTASHHHSEAHLEPRRSSPQSSTERPQRGHQTKPRPQEEALDETPVGVNTSLLSPDIQGILDDLQLDCKASEKEQRARKSSRGRTSNRRGGLSQARTPVSAWGAAVAANPCPRTSRSASPVTRQPDSTSIPDRGHKKRHYDADAVRQYIARQQEERKKRQAAQKRAQMEEAERKNQRLKALYEKQREVAKTLSAEASVAPVQRRLQETYTKLMLEEAQLGEEATQDDRSTQMMPMYQPSGESDKENKRLEALQSPSSSDKSLNDLPPPCLSRNDLEAGVSTFPQPDPLNAAVQRLTGPDSHAPAASNEHLLSQLLRLEAAVAASNMKHTTPPAAAASSTKSPSSKMSRIEALKATAASLSSRIESEARKLAGQGINYGATTSFDVDALLAPRASNVEFRGWKGTVPYSSENPASPRSQRILSSPGHRSHSDNVLPGVGNLHDFRETKVITHNGLTNVHRLSPDVEESAFNSYIQKKRRTVGGLELEERTNNVGPQTAFNNQEVETNVHDSSAGSISEGPLLSEGSLSDDEMFPPRHPSRNVPKPDYLKAADHYASQKRENQRLLEFQREAAMSSALSPPQLESSKAHWEELNKGSPLSVINIFTKNLQVSERNVEPKSPHASPLHSDNGRGSPAVYEEDFVSSQSSKTSDQMKRGSNSSSTKNHLDELMRRCPYDKGVGGSASHSPHRSSGSASASSPSRHPTKHRRMVSDQSDHTVVGEQRSWCSTPSEALSSDARKRGSADSQRGRSQDTFRGGNGPSPERSSYSGSPNSSSQLGPNSSNEAAERGRLPANHSKLGTSVSNGELQYSPAVLQQRMAAELQYLESMQNSIRQLGDVERLMGVSMAQQESASLAQMLKVKQQRHERELYELKIKAEREALEAKLQLEENRQQVARAHIELQESLAASQKEALEGLQESTSKMMSQQAEAAQHTADAARNIKEMTELARSQIVGTLIAPPVAVGSDQQDQQRTSYCKKQEDKSDCDSSQSEVFSRRSGSEVPLSSINSLSHSDSFRGTHLRGATSSSSRRSSSRHREAAKTEAGRRMTAGADREDAANSSIEENIPGATNDSLCSDSIPSAVDEKADSTSVATEYSLKYDESMTEDDIEERSFRSVLPSESHRRGTVEKKSHHLDEWEDEGGSHNAALVSGTPSQNSLKTPDVHITFSGGQDSFSQFTMDMVRQYMKDEEVRLQHQSSLLHLRQKALKEKTKTELAWLELQKKRLRDKGEDDKMPPIRKKQRGLLIKLQQEQAEIKRLQEANRAARKERQLLLKQQQEIERMRNSTLRLKERLKCAEGKGQPESPVLEHLDSEAASSNMSLAADARSPSPSHSVSGSETSSIMQKLKKMHSHTDEKHCSPVHLFFSVFTAQNWASLSVCLPNLHPKIQLFIYKQLIRFLTKREQQLMQRRHHAEELLQWKQRLDQEEAEVRRMEKEALAVWERKRLLEKDLKKSEVEEEEIPETASQPDSHHSPEPQTDVNKGENREGDSSTTADSIVHTEGTWTQKPGSPSLMVPVSDPKTPLTSAQSSPANYSQDFTSASCLHSRQSSPHKGSHSPAASPANTPRLSQTASEVLTRPPDSSRPSQSDNISDQSDIESRIKALKEELRKQKLMAFQLKKEQKKRHVERLMAEEASLLKQLETYNNFIEKTKAELSKDSTPESVQIKDSNSNLEPSSAKPPSSRPETGKSSEGINESEDHNTFHEEDGHGSPSVHEERAASPEQPDRPPAPERQQSQEPASDVQEELELSSRPDQELSLQLLRLSQEDELASQEKLPTADQVCSSMKGNQNPPETVLTPEQSQPMKRNDTSEQVSASVQHPSSADDFKSVSVTSSKRTQSLKDAEASTRADGYPDDFESAGTSAREDHVSKPDSPSGIQLSSKDSTNDSQDSVGEEEILEELSQHPLESEDSHPSGRLLDIYQEKHGPMQETKSVNSSYAPPISPQQTPAVGAGDEMPSFNIGDRVLVGGVQPGTLRFKGPTRFANGFWAGVELDQSEGSNNGTYDGVVYFECKDRHGIFAPPDKIAHFPDKFEPYNDATEDEDSFSGDFSNEGGQKNQTSADSSERPGHGTSENAPSGCEDAGCENKKKRSHLTSPHTGESGRPVSNGNTADIILDFQDPSHPLIISDVDTAEQVKEADCKTRNLLENKDVSQPFTSNDLKTGIENHQQASRDLQGKQAVDTFADELLKDFLGRTVEQFSEIKKVKEQKIVAANQMHEEKEEEGKRTVEQKDGLPFFLPAEQEELSSPELWNKSESPVLGASGQEELAKRLAELELSRELLEDQGDDQDWFDEDFGLSSRRKQILREKEEAANLPSSAGPAMGTTPSVGGEGKTPLRPELPPPPKLPEQPAMVVPHSVTEVGKMVRAATREIWEACSLGKGGARLDSQTPNPTPSLEFLRDESRKPEQEAVSIRSYKQAVFDLTWEIIQQIYAEDPVTDQPQWVKPRQFKSSSIYQVKTSGDINKIQEFVTAEILKLFGLKQDQNQKTDWQKMLKFGRKKRDRVDQILVQELQEEEAQWVNYDEDELSVKMQLADSIFDALLKDTAETFTGIFEKRPALASGST